MCSAVDYPGVKGKCYLITGASSGIGKATAILLSQLGARVILVARNAERLSGTLSLMDNNDHLIVTQDLAEIPDMRGWMQQVLIDAGQPLSGIAHCAGRYTFLPLRGFNKATFSEEFERFTNTSAVLFDAACKIKLRTSSLSLVAMSSLSAHSAHKGNAIYAAVRASLETMVKYFAVEYATKGIRCNSVVAGLLSGTNMSGNAVASFSNTHLRQTEERYPLGIGLPEDAANTITFLLGSSSRWITGTSMIVDGGFLALGI